MKRTLNDYKDIIDLDYPFFTNRKRMSMSQRGAQFAPFAALTGFEDEVEEKARLTDEMIELTEQEKHYLDEQLLFLEHCIDRLPLITVTYFLPDSKKEGGAYVKKSGQLKKIDAYNQRIVFMDKEFIEIEKICRIESDLLDPINFYDEIGEEIDGNDY